jgi:hypothetical protein
VWPTAQLGPDYLLSWVSSGSPHHSFSFSFMRGWGARYNPDISNGTVSRSALPVLPVLPAACCLLPAACCLLPAACCLLPAACCLLPVAPHAAPDALTRDAALASTSLGL